jgi:hypothetical protein
MYGNNRGMGGRPEDWQMQKDSWKTQRDTWKDLKPNRSGFMTGDTFNRDGWETAKDAWKNQKPMQPNWGGGLPGGGNPGGGVSPPPPPAPDLGVNAGGYITNAQTGQSYLVPNGLDQEGYRQALLGWGFAPSPYI